ncbi:FkbM family methyltransferase [Massilia sp. CFBP9012]|uniref:FkbM family methyltransferase n=1 Tax=Massilia sp. CFBP9012 TaxID=3096531 RepID=UPI002A6AA543|nr:FkbM family methyltransferase [Massilia sp. CFBP9012]MDY0978202.1 FkbM family methyltransferase [Massilia sp. CFBP9012]
MTFVSYSQNSEDVLLWRALGHVKDGFYIDVGANDPVEHSVTKAFYDAGWRGISIEPLPSFHQAFEEQRPRDVNLAIAAGATDGELTLYDVPAVRGWASPDESVAELHRSEGHVVAELKVPVRTLAAICAEHVQGDIHFLKIDVEGFEGEVLRGMDFKRWRPWVLVIEATLPNSRATNHETWEHLVTSQGYAYAWFDGLNRYYVAAEHPDLLALLDIQPNVFDDYITHHLDSAWKQIDALRAQSDHGWQRAAELERQVLDYQERAEFDARTAAELAQRSERLRQELATVRQELRASEAQLQQVELQAQTLTAQLHETAAWGKDLEQRLLATLSSTSWRITAPLRFIARRGPDGLVGLTRRKARGAARRLLRWLTSREALRRTVLPLVMRSPKLQALLSRLLTAAKQATQEQAAHGAAVPHAQRELPQSARDALEQLRRAYEPNKD